MDRVMGKWDTVSDSDAQWLGESGHLPQQVTSYRNHGFDDSGCYGATVGFERKLHRERNKMYVFIMVLECAVAGMDCKAVTYATTDLDDFVDQCAPTAWAAFFQKQEVQKYVKDISVAIKAAVTKTYEPAMPLMFRALEMVAPSQVKVVILGQDPTPQPGKATGLAFSVDNPKTVGTVLNVLLEVALEGFNVDINNGNLESWANQGVLLLNTAFTCEQGKRDLN
ncbi:hypothetical protein OS493_032969 [Desmophyllum pertusum]|uniref:Uracil-DNA glycosylase-like domain-containing protein n=1 Tax=Desmophyllum pertusum TaxID=174260 RepID=A0A9W9Y844_9CNID|nr:hypothetical protein OS493_032969 [Desmophyllum pertusum]